MVRIMEDLAVKVDERQGGSPSDPQLWCCFRFSSSRIASLCFLLLLSVGAGVAVLWRMYCVLSWNFRTPNLRTAESLSHTFSRPLSPLHPLQLNASLQTQHNDYPIPPVVIQSWKDSKLPEAWARNQRSWKECSGLQVVTLTDAQNRQIIEDHYPWLLEAYDSLDKNIMRVDVARVAALHLYGGIYSDLDISFKCVDNEEKLENYRQWIHDLRKENKLVLPPTRPFGYSNDFMMSPPGHPLLLHYLQRIVQMSNDHFFPPYLNVMAKTGPLFLTGLVNAWPNQSAISVMMEERYTGGDSSFLKHSDGNSWHEWDAVLIMGIWNTIRKKKKMYRIAAGVLAAILMYAVYQRRKTQWWEHFQQSARTGGFGGIVQLLMQTRAAPTAHKMV